jgi:2-iminobutanoate/2-iminopropanoate deaminase
VSDLRHAVATDAAPSPAGSYSQAVLAGGVLYISGQVPRTPDGVRHGNAPFERQALLTLSNVESIAAAAGTRLSAAAFLTVYLRDPASQAEPFDRIYRTFLTDAEVLPARAVVQSDLPHGDIEITAIIPAPDTASIGGRQ